MGKHKKGISAGGLTMLALGTVVGGSFFLGSSVAINAAGPSIIIAYVFSGVLVYYILCAMSEMAVAYPHYGGFRTFAAKAFGQRTGFIVGWVYWTGMVLGMSSEATAVSILLRGWAPQLSLPLLGSLVIICVTGLNLLGVERLSKLESALSAVKVATVVSFIVVAILLVTGLYSGRPAVGLGEILREPFAPGGIRGLLGSMLIVMFSYCGFEIIAMAASEVSEPHKMIPKAIRYTVFSLVGMFFLYIVLLLPLIPTAELNESQSAIVAALLRHGITWAGGVIAVVVVSAIFSTMLATMFGLGRIMRAMTDAGQAPRWLKEATGVPYRGILLSGAVSLLSFWFGLLFPRVYLFLLSTGGFSALFTYAVMMASHLRLRKMHGCPPEGKCQMPGYPYASWFVLVSLVVAIAGMPFVKGQTSGLIAGIVFLLFFQAAYSFLLYYRRRRMDDAVIRPFRNTGASTEVSRELTDLGMKDKERKDKNG